MADPTFIRQQATLVGADAAQTDVAQQTTLVGADSASTEISQQSTLAGADDARTAISQQATAVGADDAGTKVSQFLLLVGRGPEVVPHSDSPSSTFVFDEGLGASWYIVPQLSDSGVEMRDKVVKSVSVRGKVTNASFGVFGYGALDEVDVAAIEAGNINSLTGVRTLPNTTQVVQSKRYPLNVHNVTNHTLRVQGRWTGEGIRDRIDELVYELAVHGARR